MSVGPELVASVAADGFESLLERGRAAATGPADPDVVELRLDGLAASWLADVARDSSRLAPLADLAREVRADLMVACHGAEAFGKFDGTAAQRLAVLRSAAEHGAARVDVHVDLAGDLGPLARGARAVLSEHVSEATPADGDLEGRFAALRARAGADGAIKLVTHATCAEDGLRLLAAGARASGRRSFFCSGSAGTFTRLFAPLVGGSAIYASAGAATAPGQLDAAAVRAACPAHGWGGGTRAFAVVGSPIGHSRSPATHAAAQRAAGLDAVFAALEPRDFDAFLDLATAFDPLRGLAVTAPFKLDALRRGVAADGGARSVGAANTLVRADGGWTASNTDVAAVEALVADVEPASALVLGAGGAGRAAVAALGRRGWRVAVAARRLEAARAVAAELGATVLPWARCGLAEPELVVQATPVGGPQDPEGLPFEPQGRFERLIEANYGAGPTPLERWARAAGVEVRDGGDWFVAQAKAQFECFHGVSPPVINWRAVFDAAGAASGAPPH